MQRKDVTPNSDKKVYCKIWDWFSWRLGGALILGGAYSGIIPHPTAEIMRRRRHPLITATQKSAM